VAESIKTIRKQVFANIQQAVNEACETIHKESERLIQALEWRASLDSPLDPAKQPLVLQDQSMDRANQSIETTDRPIDHLDPCRIPPEGWSCTRSVGHEGPCAAVEQLRETVREAGIMSNTQEQKEYDARHDIQAKHYLTMLHPSDTNWVIERVRERIKGKVVVEIGAGVGVLALELAKHAKHVYAIEADPAWTWAFMRDLYKTKPTNLTWIMDDASNMVDIIKGDVAIVSTGSDEDRLRELAGYFAPEVIMPWQDWRGGKAIVSNGVQRSEDPTGLEPIEKPITPVCGVCGVENCCGESPAKAICIDATPKGCNCDWHPPECEGDRLRGCQPARLECKNCHAPINFGNCCCEPCTTIWMSKLHFTGNQRLCRTCGQPHEMKSNFCNQCHEEINV